VKPAPIEDDDEQRYKPIEWPLLKRMLAELKPFKRQYLTGISVGSRACAAGHDRPEVHRRAHQLLHRNRRRAVQSESDADKIHRVLFVMMFWVIAVTGSIILQRNHDHHHDPPGETVQFALPGQAFQSSARAVVELFRQDQARPDHQQDDQRH